MAFISIVDYKFKTIMDNTAQITSRKTVKDGNKTRVVEDYYEAVPYEPMRLKVAYDDGVKFTPDVKIQVNDLNKGKKQFLNLSGTGDKFKITVLVHNKEIWNSGVHGANGKLKRGYVRSVLNKWIRNMKPEKLVVILLQPPGKHEIYLNDILKHSGTLNRYQKLGSFFFGFGTSYLLL